MRFEVVCAGCAKTFQVQRFNQSASKFQRRRAAGIPFYCSQDCYTQFLGSVRSYDAKLRALDQAPTACTICGSGQSLRHHHIYGRRASEDTTVLCEKCENAIHGRPHGHIPKGKESEIARLMALLPLNLVDPRAHDAYAAARQAAGLPIPAEILSAATPKPKPPKRRNNPPRTKLRPREAVISHPTFGRTAWELADMLHVGNVTIRDERPNGR